MIETDVSENRSTTLKINLTHHIFKVHYNIRLKFVILSNVNYSYFVSSSLTVTVAKQFNGHLTKLNYISYNEITKMLWNICVVKLIIILLRLLKKWKHLKNVGCFLIC